MVIKIEFPPLPDCKIVPFKKGDMAVLEKMAVKGALFNLEHTDLGLEKRLVDG